MSAYRRNVLVGVTVLLGLGILGWMILQFGENLATPFAPRQIPITFLSDRADGVASGSPIRYRGLDVGRVSRVRRSDDGSRVEIRGMIDQQPPIPANVIGEIRLTSFVGGGSAVVLDVPDGQDPAGALTADQTLAASFVGFDLIPPDVDEVARQVRIALTEYNQSNLLANVNDKVTRFGGVIDRAETLLGDEQVIGDLRVTVQNARETSESFRRVGQRAEAIGERVTPIVDTVAAASQSVQAATATGQRLVTKAHDAFDALRDNAEGLLEDTRRRVAEASAVIASANAVLNKVDRGTGTAGRLVNDPRAYEAAVDSLRLLEGTLADIQRLVQQIEQEGATIRFR